ncbi:MAG: tetratricopeptide repeat protein [Planctomycetes bacterium]|nr:tetratricopeptide repeat protein [Planctomycetota bacterium]MBL7147018.1 tetratricopeptide repeat protein [Phycisphaerae bacterium]
MKTKHPVTIVALIGTIIVIGVCGCKEAKDYYNRGVARFEKGETDGAISDFTKAIKKRPGYGMAYYYRAMTYHRKKEYDQAWEDVHKAQSLGQEVRFLEILRKDSGRKK